VGGQLAITRALGDLAFKTIVHIPNIIGRLQRAINPIIRDITLNRIPNNRKRRFMGRMLRLSSNITNQITPEHKINVQDPNAIRDQEWQQG